MLNKAGYRIILDEDPEDCVVFAVNVAKIIKSKSFPFISSLSNLDYIKTEPICLRQFRKMSGYDLWHRRLGHCTNRNIRETITHSTGREDLRSRTFEEHTKCPSCMIGKRTLEDLPKLKDLATEPLHQVNMDIFSSSIQSIGATTIQSS